MRLNDLWKLLVHVAGCCTGSSRPILVSLLPRFLPWASACLILKNETTCLTSAEISFLIWDESFWKCLEETALHKSGPALELVPPQIPPVQVVVYAIHSGCVRPAPRLPFPSLPPPSIALRPSSPNPPHLPTTWRLCRTPSVASIPCAVFGPHGSPEQLWIYGHPIT